MTTANPDFSRRHFEKVAMALARALDDVENSDATIAQRLCGKAGVLTTASALADVFEADNTRFNVEKFFAAVLGITEAEATKLGPLQKEAN